MQYIASKVSNLGSFIKYISVFFTSLIPLVESKGAIVLGAALKIKWYITYLITSIGSYIVTPFIMYCKRISDALQKWADKTQIKNDKIKELLSRYGAIGLGIIVSIPFTGVTCWISSLIARKLDLDKKQTCICIFIGNCVGCFITAALVYGVSFGIKSLID